MKRKRYIKGEMALRLKRLKPGQLIRLSSNLERINLLHGAQRAGIKITTRAAPFGGYIAWIPEQK